MNKISKQLRVLTMLTLGLLTILGISQVNAEESNRSEIRDNLQSGGWIVIYGDLINEADYLEFGAAVAAAVICECVTPLEEFMKYQINEQIERFERSAIGISKLQIAQMLIDSFNGGGIYSLGNLEVEADLATYRRWEVVIYDEPRTYKCKQDLWPAGWTWSICTTTESVTKTIPLPNNFQPYIRFRLGDIVADPVTDSYDRIYLKNNCDRSISAAIRYENLEDVWTTGGWFNLDPGEENFVAKTQNTIFYTYAISQDGQLTWGGDDNYQTIRGSSEEYGFRKSTITTTSWGKWEQNFTCNN